MEQVLLYKELSGKKVQCQNCAHYCIIEDNKRGKCNVKENKNGKLFSLVYGRIAALSIDPIEKKPLFHFLPGTYSLSFCTVGCNFKCLNCQNYNISQIPRENNDIFGKDLSPEKMVSIALENNLPSISYTYTEPAVFSEYALDVMKLARKKGLKNIWVSNGFWSKELFNLIYPYLDAVNIDIKSSEDSFYVKYCGAKLKPVLDTLKRLKEKRIWTEITTLVIPTLNDKEKVFKEIANFIKNELGKETPWHISRFSGAISWKLQNIPDTPIKTLEKAKEIGKKVGLKNIYIGNV